LPASMALEESSQEASLRRLQAMGIRAQLMPGGRCVLGRMRLQRRIFETSTTPIVIDEVTFTTVGSDRAKCVHPRALFQLPILRIQDCRDATAIEARIHLAWQRHSTELAKTQAWLRGIGAHSSDDEERSVVKFPLAGEDPLAFARMIDRHRVILPSRGPLSGIALQRVDDRLMKVDTEIESANDLEMSVASRLEQLARLDTRLAEQRRLKVAERPPLVVKPAADRSPMVLLVGPRISQERSCIEALQRRGFRVMPVLGQREAIASFDLQSPELVLTDVQLGRAEGIELVQALRSVPGIEEVPVVLIDGHDRRERREVARRIGAAGYLVYPLDVEQIAEHLDRIVNEPRRRRFTRYDERLAVRIRGHAESCVTTSIGRGGMFLATDEDIPTNTVHECQLALPGTGSKVRIEGEVLYRASTAGVVGTALGVRFRSFPEFGEPVLIDYLKHLHPALPVPPI
jgi:two-component system chemotaxis response regulator CheY